MTWSVQYSERAHKQLRKLDPSVARIVVGWMKKNVHDCADPRGRGKALSRELSGLWRYRIGTYRVICEIRDDIVTVLVLDARWRSSIY